MINAKAPKCLDLSWGCLHGCALACVGNDGEEVSADVGGEPCVGGMPCHMSKAITVGRGVLGDRYDWCVQVMCVCVCVCVCSGWYLWLVC